MRDYSVDDDDNNAEQGLYDKYVKRKFIQEQSEHRVCTDEGKKRFRDIDIGIGKLQVEMWKEVVKYLQILGMIYGEGVLELDTIYRWYR